jgi:hypothetical protein
MPTIHRLLLAAAVLSAGCGAAFPAAAVASPSALKPHWSSTAPFGEWTSGPYSINNDVWGKGVGPQTLWANSVADWGVHANHPNTGGIKSYPHISYTVGKKVSALHTLTSTVSTTTPTGGAWESAYDIWDSDHAHEIMLWLKSTGTTTGGGNVKPISRDWSKNGDAIPVYTNVSIGGSTWNVFRGSNGTNEVYSFLRTSGTDHVTIDVKALLQYLVNLGWMGDVVVGEVQFGFEITSSPGGLDYGAQNFSVTAR